MKKWIIYLIIIVVLVIGGIITYNIIKNKFEQKDKEIADLKVEIEYYKNAANPSGEVIDSLQYNVDYRDTVIYNIKQEFIKDVEVIKNMPDSTAIKLFNSLVWSDQ